MGLHPALSCQKFLKLHSILLFQTSQYILEITTLRSTEGLGEVITHLISNVQHYSNISGLWEADVPLHLAHSCKKYFQFKPPDSDGWFLIQSCSHPVLYPPYPTPTQQQRELWASGSRPRHASLPRYGCRGIFHVVSVAVDVALAMAVAMTVAVTLAVPVLVLMAMTVAVAVIWDQQWQRRC